MATSVAPNNSHLQQMLQSAVQAVQWTYGIFWQFCSQQGTLIWVDGYYNGDIKTRKTLQTTETGIEEASGIQRSQQLRELYYSLLAGELNQPPARRLYVALSPEDLTDLEWFYLLCISFSFPPGIGLPGKAYVARRHIWLTGAHEVDNKIFSRSILAKSANIQTVVCIPLIDGVVELGFTETVEEKPSMVLEIKKIFNDHHDHHRHDHHCLPLPLLGPPQNSAFSSHSNSSFASADQCQFPLVPMYAMENPPILPHDRLTMEDEGDHERNFRPNGSDLETEDEQKISHAGLEGPPNNVGPNEPDDLMQLEFFDDIQLSSPEYASDNIDCDVMPKSSMDHPSQLSHYEGDSIQPVKFAPMRPTSMQEQHQLMPSFTARDSKSSGGFSPLEELNSQAEEDSHYSQILSTILQTQSSSSATSTAIFPTSPKHFSSSSSNSAFLKFTSEPNPPLPPHLPTLDGSAQRLLKYVLFAVPSLHAARQKPTQASACLVEYYPRPCSTTKQDESSISHVLAERRRREKLNERFIILRSLVPFVTKTDKASILGDTIEYLKHLQSKIQELEARERQTERKRVRMVKDVESDHHNGFQRIRKVQMVDAGRAKALLEVGGKLEVSIIESDALVELHCLHREGLLLDIMLTLRDLDVEVTAVHSSLHDGYLEAELRAKVNENCKGRKASIMEVKRAVKQVVPDTDL